MFRESPSVTIRAAREADRATLAADGGDERPWPRSRRHRAPSAARTA